MSDPLIAMLQPTAGRAAPWRNAVKAFCRPTRRGYQRIEIEQGTSSTPRTFNMCWADMLNLIEDGVPLTHALMHHDDIAPDHDGKQPSFNHLDVLMDEMGATGCDVLSAVVPIKNDLALTSTAVDNPDDPWIVRRLTMAEVMTLPETFSAADVPWNHHGGCLLPNTGLWLCKLGDWAKPPGFQGFQFHNKLRQRNGRWGSVDTAEDWDFGRQAHALGLKVLCTRKVKLAHGEPRFHNRSAWGLWPTDLAYLNYQRLCDPLQAGWTFPEEVEGWLTETEGKALAELAQGKDVLEIGSYCGRSTVCLAQQARSLCAVDPFDGRTTDKQQNTLALFMEAIARYGCLAKVKTIVATAAEASHILEDEFDLAFIDGDHRREAVLTDATVALDNLRAGGLLAFHDYRLRPGDHDGRWDPGVTAAVNDLVAGGAEMVGLHGTVAVLRPAA